MQPLSPSSHLTAANAFASHALRKAQRAFAPLLERSAGDTTFRFAQLRGAARRSLSALSADDRVRLAHWLALLCVAADAHAGEQRLARVDAPLAAVVSSASAALRETLAAHGEDGAVAA